MATNPVDDDLLGATALALRTHLAPVTFGAGSVIVREGDPAGSAYLIERGQVRVSKRAGSKEVELGVLGPGELVGEMSPVDSRARSATATAVVETELIPLSAEHLSELLTQADPLLNLMVRALLDRLRNVHGHIAGALAEDPASEPSPRDGRYSVIREQAVTQVRTERALRAALGRREFVLHYQPIVDLAKERIAGFEALIRWHSSERGLVPPDEFIPAAEKTGLIVPIGYWLIEEAGHVWKRLRDIRRETDGDGPALWMSVNVSARQLRTPAEVARLADAIRRSSFDCSALKLEITENLLVENSDVALPGLELLKALGLELAIDDFGTGYSSLSYLHAYPLDTLKIDRAFVSTMIRSPKTRQLVRGIIDLGRALDMAVVAEGVETAEEATLLYELGCHFGQGYLYSKPLPLEQCEALLASEASAHATA